MKKSSNNRFYSDLIKIHTFEDRFKYLQLFGKVAQETFGYERYLNQALYRTSKWKSLRSKIIIRDNGCDLGMDGYDLLYEPIYIHHLNPITIEDIENDNPDLWDPENLVCCSFNTHQAIHYGDQTLLKTLPIERSFADTCPWKKLRKEAT